MTIRQTYSIEQIKDMLLGQLDAVVQRYAPPAPGSHTDFGKYFTLNPGRADKSVGSFCVHMSGAKMGRWNDYATKEHGDVLDLIALSMHCDVAGALREARAFLGLQTASPEDVARAKNAAARLKEQRARAVAAEREKRAARAKAGHALWLAARERIAGSPVEFYLRDQRGVDLAKIGRQPRALRYHPACKYYHLDQSTGEVIEHDYPAMLGLVVDRAGKVLSCHRTYLAMNADGLWDKAAVPSPKKVLGDPTGGWITVWNGIGPRGGKPVALAHAPHGQHVYIAEGIEDALSGVMLLPEKRFLSCYSLHNMASIALPSNVTRVTLIADQDEGPQAAAALERAIKAHQKAGRRVQVWHNIWGGKDLNDALRATIDATQGEAAG